VDYVAECLPSWCDLQIFLESLCEALRKDYINMTVTSLNIPSLCYGCHQTGGSCKQENDISFGKDSITPLYKCGQGKDQSKLGRYYTLSAPIEEYSIFYIGSEGRTLTNIIMNYPTCQVEHRLYCTHACCYTCGDALLSHTRAHTATQVL